jgi:phosphocarrier protein FPr/phosphocarrier protein
MSNLVLVAPLEGWSAPLDEVPDPVFAGRLLGDGVAIDPTSGTLHAPCDGEVISLPPQRHAVTLRAPNGAHVLLHVGIDTVALNGAGFTAHVEAGARVSAGQPLLSFDLDVLAERAKSLITPLIVTDEMPFSVVRRATGHAVRVGEFIMELAPAGARDGDHSVGDERVAEEIAHLQVPLEHGLHARPAALLVARLKHLAATVSIAAHGKSANARSAVAIMGLGVRRNDDVTITASGPDAAAAIAAIRSAIQEASKEVHASTSVSGVAGVKAVPASGAARRQQRAEATAGTDARGYANAGAGADAGVDTDAAVTAVVGVAARTRTDAGTRAAAEIRAAAQGADGATTAWSGRAASMIAGVTASPGLAVGTAFQLVRAEIQVDETGTGVAAESRRLDAALATVRANIQSSELVAHSERAVSHEVLAAHLEFLDDPELIAAARRWIEEGKSAGFAWRKAIRANVDVLRSLPDARMAERADDLLDVESQVLVALEGARTGAAPSATPDADASRSSAAGHAAADAGTQVASARAPAGDQLPERAIVLATELLPSQFVALDPSRLAGICTSGGGPTSHVAILAAAMNVPMLVAAGPLIRDIPNGAALILDADHGSLRLAPSDAERAAAEATVQRRRERHAADKAAAQRECRTADGARIEIFANVGSVDEARAAVAQGAEGCGLLRTEFLFLDRETAPDEATQTALYSGIVTAFGGRPVVVRTLDTGGDKPLAYMPLAPEDNPALGVRGVRIGLLYPQVLRAQLRAILSAEPRGRCRILLPMISDPSEVRAIGEMLDDVRCELGHDAPVPLGAMIETPAAAMIADQIALEADFLSIGTNDLTQYALAIDRGNPALAARLDSLHPAVLRLIAKTAAGARLNCRDVAVCGGLASDPVAVPILIGLGVNELSAVPAVIPRLKALISTLTLDACQTLARRALEQPSATEVRALVANAEALAQ